MYLHWYEICMFICMYICMSVCFSLYLLMFKKMISSSKPWYHIRRFAQNGIPFIPMEHDLGSSVKHLDTEDLICK